MEQRWNCDGTVMELLGRKSGETREMQRKNCGLSASLVHGNKSGDNKKMGVKKHFLSIFLGEL
jgi:hypothetical protein